MSDFPSLSTDQVAALVELARAGSLREAAEALHVSEQGVRSRLIALESRMGAELYRKQRGQRRSDPLTPAGRRLLPQAISFLERSRELTELFAAAPPPRDVQVVASQYLIAYVLIDVVRRFHRRFADIRIRLSARTEREIERTLSESPDFSLGVAAPYEPSLDLDYRHLFSMQWSLIAPPRHAVLSRKNVRLDDLADAPLVLYESGSTGRQHVMEAFQRRGISPRVEMEATGTDLIVRMVEAGLGLGIVPLLPGGAVTRGRRVKSISLGSAIRPIDSGLLTRRGEELPPAARAFFDFTIAEIGRVVT